MTRGAKKNQAGKNGDAFSQNGDDPLSALEKNCKKLQEKYDLLAARSRKEVGDLGFWGVVGGLGLAADWMFMGGLGTAIAAWSAGEAIMYGRRAREVGRELTDVKTRINDMQQQRFEAQIQQLKNAPSKPANENSLKDEFSPAAKAEIEALRAKLARLENQVGQLQEDKNSGIDKPKLRKPPGKKPGE